MKTLPKVFIVGESGTTGLRLQDRLSERKDIELLHLPEDKRKDIPTIQAFAKEADLMFLCLPDAASKEVVEAVKDIPIRILDTSTAHRTDDDWVYGFPELSKDQKEAMAALTKYFPLALIMLLVILVMLFGNFRQPLIIFLILPLSLIGMVFGLWVTGFQFGFFCIAGWLGLLGMIIKNVIVLLDEVNIQQKAGVEPYTAVIEATVSRARPVLMAALTTVFGLSFATLLTLFVTPALYTVFYKISKRGE